MYIIWQATSLCMCLFFLFTSNIGQHFNICHVLKPHPIGNPSFHHVGPYFFHHGYQWLGPRLQNDTIKSFRHVIENNITLVMCLKVWPTPKSPWASHHVFLCIYIDILHSFHFYFPSLWVCWFFSLPYDFLQHVTRKPLPKVFIDISDTKSMFNFRQ